MVADLGEHGQMVCKEVDATAIDPNPHILETVFEKASDAVARQVPLIVAFCNVCVLRHSVLSRDDGDTALFGGRPDLTVAHLLDIEDTPA